MELETFGIVLLLHALLFDLCTVSASMQEMVPVIDPVFNR